MPDYILIQDTNHKWQRAAEKELPDEGVLQQLIRDNPEVLPLDDLGDDIPPLLIVGRETALPNGYVDVIGVDADGLVTLIECKLDRNPEVKRTVTGQILGYASYLWGMTYHQFESEVACKYFDSDQCHRADWRGIPLDDAMATFVLEQATAQDWDVERFRQQLESNLRDGRFRLVIVVDKVNDEMRRTVEYLNACTGPNFDILCAELRYFGTEHTRLIVPALLGKPLASKPTSRRVLPHVQWNPQNFFSELSRTSGPQVEQIARRLLDWSSRHSDKVYWGTGIRDGSFSALVRWNADRVANVFGVWTNGRIEMGFQYLRPYPPFNEENERIQLLTRLNEIKGIALAPEQSNRRPSIPIAVLADDARFQQFTDTMQWVIQELRAYRDKQQQ